MRAKRRAARALDGILLFAPGAKRRYTLCTAKHKHTDTHARVRTPVGSDAAETRRRVNVCVCAVAVVAVVVERNDEATRVMGNNEKYSERLFVAARHAAEVHSAINTQGARAGACSDQKFEYIVQDDTTRHSSWGGGFVAFRVVAVSVCLAKLLQAKLQH